VVFPGGGAPPPPTARSHRFALDAACGRVRRCAFLLASERQAWVCRARQVGRGDGGSSQVLQGRSDQVDGRSRLDGSKRPTYASSGLFVSCGTLASWRAASSETG
jgi:hypothetical protein